MRKHIVFRRRQCGFSLAELVVVVVIIGILAAVAANQYRSFVDKAVAAALIDISQRIAGNHTEMAQYFRTSKLATSSSIPKTNNSVMDVMVHGRDFVNATLLPKYDTSGFRPITSALTTTTMPVAGTSAGAYQLQGYTATFTTPDVRTAKVALANVPSHIVEIVWVEKMQSTFNAGSAVNSGPVQYTAASGGTHTLTLEYPI